MPSVTEEFCAAMLGAARGPLTPAVERAAGRSLLNVLGTAVSAAGSDAVRVLLAAADDAASAGDASAAQVTVPGLTRTLDPYWAALAIGTAAHLDDFDDTHLATVIHPGAATLAAVLSLVPETVPSGAAFLGAFAAGCEAQLRIGCAVSPAHYDAGWHITGTCGVFGAAVAASALLGLDVAATARALSLAATMTAGHREAFGTMTKPLHAGKAAANGVLAARFAAAGLTGPADPLGPDGVLDVLAASVDREALGLGWPAGHRWELELNTIKTYPCGVVAHPAMDAAIAASARVAQFAGRAEISGITLRCKPLVPELMGLEQPEDGLRSRFSARHGVAVGLLYGRAGLAEFSDAALRGRDSAAARALLEIRPPAPPSGEAAWAAWAMAAAAAGGSAAAHGHEADKGAETAAGTRLTWLAVFAAGTAIGDTALADPAGSSGRVTVLAAIAAGMSAAAIIESGLDDRGGWSPGTVAAAISAGLTAGLLLGLAEQQLRAAIGICATQATGLRAAAGTDAFALQVGKAAFNGVEAALLARAGLTAPAEPLDGRRGLFALFTQAPW